MSKTFALAIASVTLAVAAPAMAQDAPQDARATNLAGLKIGAVIGYDQSRAGSSSSVVYDNRKIDGLLYGGTAGFDIPLGDRIIAGPEVEYTDGNAKTSYNQPGFGLGSVSTGRDLYAGGRLGFVTSPKSMIYAKAGYTNTRYHVRANDGTLDYRNSLGASGYRVGAGYEVDPTPKTFIRAEYRYSNYGRAHVVYGNGAAPSSGFDIDTDRHQVVATVGVKF